MDRVACELVESEWASWLGIRRDELHSPGVHVVAADVGANAAMSFLFDETCFIAVPPTNIDITRPAVVGVAVEDAFTKGFLHSLVGHDCHVDGPSSHWYVSERTFTGHPGESVSQMSSKEHAFLEFLSECDKADVQESGFSPEADSARGHSPYWVVQSRGRVVGAGKMSDWRGYPADVGVLTHPDHRGQGHAARLVAAMVQAALPSAGVVRYRALTTNGPSLAVARRVGFEPFGQNFRARRA